ncbi:hypothetical protein B0H10DRAFT_2197379 [Mycena sp. CBHHK59/15]|nr:hypothetical protein B0H10DRAFT_2197379 [Mycena sp. CBHHK59/15]
MNAISLLCSKKRATLVRIELTQQEVELTTLSQHTMPEAREGIASGKQANNGFETAKGIAAEATKSEAGLCSASSEIKEGLVYDLDAYSTLQYLTHTLVQFYPYEKWEKSIRNVCKFSIGVAFIFTSQVLAFPSIDMVFQISQSPPNIFSSTGEFLVLVADWIESILLKPRYTRACDTIRNCNNIFYGIGVYTVMELFLMAGLSPFLTLYEVFSNPSCTARFLTAFYSYIAQSEQDLWTLLQPCIHDGILAPTTDQCLRYADWLYVWAKERTSMPLHMAQLVDEFHLCDVFESTILGPGLESQMNLGHLIFGDDTWLLLGGRRCAEDDPITTVYQKHSSSPTSIKFRGPDGSYPLDKKEKGRCRHCAYILRADRLVELDVLGLRFKLLTRESFIGAGWAATIERDSLSVSIGPLEYCGVGHIIYIGPNAYVAVCKGDPMIPEYHEKHFLSGLDRVGSHLDTTGKYKRVCSQQELKRLVKKLPTVEKGYKRAGVDLEVPVHDKGLF